ncbi:hypothetical protein LJC08_06460 [Methanimicrococcus sp. OttesenSCG-928-J09]|nr:hypothetical protein [Methanimicrococcus sp. OttesenSCG-928-J09]
MNKYILFRVIFLTAVISMIFAAGCINKTLPPLDANGIDYDSDDLSNLAQYNLADVNSVVLYTEGNVLNAIPSITFHKKNYVADIQNISVTIVGSDVKVLIPVLEMKKGTEIMPAEDFSVIIGTKSQFEEGKDYRIIINGEDDKDEIPVFKFMNGTLVQYKPAVIENLRIKEVSGSIVVVSALASNESGIAAVDQANITSVFHKDEKAFDLYVPLQITEEESSETFRETEEIIIAETKDLKDGKYEIHINGNAYSFKIRNNQLIA